MADLYLNDYMDFDKYEPDYYSDLYQFQNRYDVF